MSPKGAYFFKFILLLLSHYLINLIKTRAQYLINTRASPAPGELFLVISRCRTDQFNRSFLTAAVSLLLLLCNSQGSILYCPLRLGQALWLAPSTWCLLGTGRERLEICYQGDVSRTENWEGLRPLGRRGEVIDPATYCCTPLQPRYHWSCPVRPLPLRAVVLKGLKVEEM